MQTNIDHYFKARKRPAQDELSGYPAKFVARKLFDCDTHVERVRTPPPAEETNQDEPAPVTTPVAKTESEEQAGPSTPSQSPSSQETLRQKLNLGEFKKVVRRSKKYTLLKKKLEKFNTSANRLKEIKETLSELGGAELQKFDSVDVEVPSSPVKCGKLRPRRLFWTSPGRSPAKELSYVSPKKLLNEGPKQVTPVKASFEKYNHLLASGKEPLVLPYKYLILKEVFRSVDIITKIKNDRNEMVTFTKLQKDVQKMLGRNFSETHLGKIKAVYPESYDFSRERVKVAFSSEEKFELIIKRLPHCIENENESESTELTNTERLKIFHNRLLEKTKIHHQEFLSKLDPPIVVESDKIKLWHPEFDLDKVSDIEPAPLPPIPSVQKTLSAKSVLEKTHDMISINNRMKRALTAMSEEKKTEENTPSGTPTNNPIPAYQKALQGIPKSILEKIRAKQAAKMAETLTQTPAEAKEAIMLSRLPELARIMRNIFVDEKKGILPVEIVMLKIGHSYREKLSQNDLMQHMKLISKHVPGWMNFCIVRNVSYVRLSKDADMTRILGKLQKLANP